MTFTERALNTMIKETRKQNRYLRNISTVATYMFFAGLLAMVMACILVVL